MKTYNRKNFCGKEKGHNIRKISVCSRYYCYIIIHMVCKLKNPLWTKPERVFCWSAPTAFTKKVKLYLHATRYVFNLESFPGRAQRSLDLLTLYRHHDRLGNRQDQAYSYY